MADEFPPPVTVERIGTRRFVARNQRGGEVQIGSADVEGVFNPGELLAIAIGACNAMTADFSLSRRLGEDFAETVTVQSTKVADENRYRHAQVTFVLEDDAAEQLKKLTTILERAIAKGCTVGRSVEAGMTDAFTLTTASDASATGAEDAGTSETATGEADQTGSGQSGAAENSGEGN